MINRWVAIDKCIPIQVHWLLKTYPHIFIAGGFVRDAQAHKSYRDIDIYGVKDADELYAIWGAWYEQFEIRLGAWSPAKKAEAALTISNVYDTDGSYIWERRISVQLMVTGEQTMEEVLKTFDIPECRYAYSYSDPDAVLSLGGPFRPTPGTLSRLIKLTKRGWDFSARYFVEAASVYEANGNSES